MGKTSDGYISVVKGIGKITLATKVPFDKVRLGSIKKIETSDKKSKFESKFGKLEMVCDGDAQHIGISAVIVTDCHTQEFITHGLNEFKSLIQNSGVLKKAMICKMKVPISNVHRLY